jgi:hypothetical protein
MPKREEPEWLFSTRWVHAFEEDSEEGAVYRPEDSPIPLSRRPRERFQLRRDGSASLFTPGPDDRMVEEPASWAKEEGRLEVRAREGRQHFRITNIAKTGLLVQSVKGR